MNRYLVGGAVRDRLLGKPVREHDWLVTGITGKALMQLGFKPVGRDFGIFLHPSTKEQYALPRGEGVTATERELVERDLRLRDLTVNAIAIAENGELIDPLSGQRDIEAKVLRHAPGFSQDPVRILRLARLTARLADTGFHIAPETILLAQQMASDGALTAAAPERLWGEIAKALSEPHPWIFFETLRCLGALRVVLPEVDRLFGVPQPVQHHPEIDTGVHSLLTLERACELSTDPRIRLAALLHDLGKGSTPQKHWPRHIGHEQRGAHLAETLCRRLRAPRQYRELAVATALLHTDVHRAFLLKPETLLKKLKQLDAFRRPERIESLLLACAADIRGRPGHETENYPQAEYLQRVRLAACQVDGKAVAQIEKVGSAVGKRVDDVRIRQISEVKRAWSQDGDGSRI